MKHLGFFRIMMLMALSLTSFSDGTQNSDSTLRANPIDLQQARVLAKPYMISEFAEPVLVKKAEYKADVPSRVKRLTTEEVAPYYIFSRGANQGFVIVTGDDALPGVVGVTDSGDYEEDNMPPFLNWYLEKCARLVEAAQQAGAKRTSRPKTVTGRVDVSPLIKDKWGQSWPYNAYCPQLTDGSGNNAVSGCVATAASMVAHYWYKDAQHETLKAIEKYKGGENSGYTRAWPKGTIINWDLIKTKYTSSDLDAYVDAVATLVAVIGNGAGLNYGTTTGGNIHKCESVFSDVLGLEGGTEHWLSGIVYTEWSKMLYEQLIAGHPMTYAGWTEDMSAGHAVVCDGYTASNDRFHINMGWGGGGDGYFNLALGAEDSWGYNGGEEEAVTGIGAMKQNMTVTIEKPIKVYKNTVNNIKVYVENNGTLDYSGLYLYGNATGRTPSSTAKPNSSDETTIIPNDGTSTAVRFTIKPTANKYYLYVMDANKNIYATLKLEAEDCDFDLQLKGMKIDGSSDMQGDYNVVYSTKANLPITVANKSSVPYDGNLRVDIYGSSDGGENFSLTGSKTVKLSVPANDVADAELSILSSAACPIKTDTLYYAHLKLETTGGDVIAVDEGVDTIVRFVVKGTDLQVTSTDDADYLHLSGHWDYNEFLTLAKKAANKNAKGYDLTEVQSLGNVGVAPLNPNAIYYVTTAQAETAQGDNLVTTDGQCKSLRLEAGYDFLPKADFKAETATVVINQDNNKWRLFTAPCTLNVPQGMLAREVTGHTTTGISNKTNDVTTLEAGKTYLLITTSEENQQLTANDADVVVECKDNMDEAFKGNLTATTTPDKAMIIDDAEQQYFQFVDEGTAVAAMRGYFCDSKVTKAFRAFSSLALDPRYNTYGELIQTAYIALSDYGNYVEASVREEFLQSIADAEQNYSQRLLDATGVTTATETLQTAIDAFTESIADPERERDCTSYIANPSFEESSVLARGWTAALSTGVSIKKTSDESYKGVGSKGSYLLYSYNTTNQTGVALSQEVKGLPAGVYTLRAMLGCEAGESVTLYANEDSVDVPASKYGDYYLTEAKVDNINIEEGESLTIRVNSKAWYKADDFKLTYTGPSTTGIDEVVSDAHNPSSSLSLHSYDLMGRRVAADYKGILIRNGKKVLVK